MEKQKLKLILKLIIFLSLILSSYTLYEQTSGETIKIANWNLQIFGQTKASNPELMNFYANKIQNYDIIFIQEIKDKSQTAFPKLCSMLQNYSCELSSRAGRTSSKEQYGIVYKDGITLAALQDYNPDEKDRWERPPIKTLFTFEDYKLIIYNIHIKPDNAQQELEYLEQAIPNQGNTIVLGDLNADCSYYNPEKQTEFDSWNWIVKDSDDTTVASSSCAYDRIILNNDAEKEIKDYGIDKNQITKDISDHYLVWVEMKV